MRKNENDITKVFHVDRSQSVFYFVPQENTVKLARLMSSWHSMCRRLPFQNLRWCKNWVTRPCSCLIFWWSLILTVICPRQRVEADCSVKEAPDVKKNRKRTSFLLLQGNSPSHQQDEHHLHFVYFKADKASAELRQEIQQLWTNFGQNHVYFAPISSMQWQTMQQSMDLKSMFSIGV